MFEYAKSILQDRGLYGPGRVRVSTSGCLGRCALGPAVVIYPEGVWYSYATREDIDDIIEQHLVKGEIVERLLMPAAS